MIERLCCSHCCYVFFFQAEDGIRDLVRSRGLGDVYKRQALHEALIQANDQQGRCCEQQGNAPAALAAYRQALTTSEQLRAWLAADEFQIGFMEDKLPIYAAAIRLTRRLASPAQVLYTLNLASRAPLPHTDAEPGGEITPERAALQTRLAVLREAWHWQQSKAEQALAADAMPTHPPARAVPDRDRQILHTLEAEMAEIGRRLAAQPDTTALSATAAPGSRWDEPTAAAFVKAQQARLRQDEALVVYFLADDFLHALVLTRAGLSSVITLAPMAAVERHLRTWRFHLQVVSSAGGADSLALAHAPVSYTHLRAHDTVLDLVCRLLLEKKPRQCLRHLITKR